MRKNYFLVLLAILLTANGIAQNIPSYVPKDGLVGYWPFNGNAKDYSLNANNGTVIDATLTTDRFGNTNSAYSFNGTSSKINIPNSNSLNPSSITLNTWIKGNTAASGWILEKRSTSNTATEFSYSIGTFDEQSISNYHGIGECSAISGDGGLTSSNKYIPGIWQMITSTIESSGLTKIYINGQIDTIINSAAFVTCNSSTTQLQFGWHWDGDPRHFNGIIDDIGIWNRALSQQEITALYTGTNCPKETATSTNFNSLLLSTGSSVSLSAEPQGGVFTGASIDSNKFLPSKAKIGANKVQYNFKNSQGCNDSTLFTMIVADTVGTTCKKYDTLTVTKYDTVIVPKTITKYDTVKVNTYDTITVTNSVTKYDTVIVNQTKYDTITVTDTVNILKINFKLTTGVKANQMTSMSIYPNPTSDVLIIDASDLAAITGYSYRILDVLGKEVYNALVTTAKTEISLKTLGAKGMYVLHILDANKQSVQTKQIILE